MEKEWMEIDHWSACQEQGGLRRIGERHDRDTGQQIKSIQAEKYAVHVRISGSLLQEQNFPGTFLPWIPRIR